MSEQSRAKLIEEIEQRLDCLLADPEISEERKLSIVRELLVIPLEEY